MNLALVLLATPLFGLSLQAPLLEPTIDLSIVSSAQLSASGELSASSDDDSEDADDSESNDSDEASSDEAGSDEASSDDASAKSDEGPAAKAQADDDYAAQNRRRNDLVKIHRPLGIATWAAMTATVGLGIIQYYNLYGFGAGQGDNPCVQGNAIFGQSQCSGTPWPHAIAAGLTTGLYAATFTISLMMPDPDDLSSGKGEFASTLRMHKLLRWVHFGGMVAQAVLGIIIANNVLGLDRANDYGTLQALSTVHLGVGLVTYGALTWAGALMTF